jgi:hypothetical protein
MEKGLFASVANLQIVIFLFRARSQAPGSQPPPLSLASEKRSENPFFWEPGLASASSPIPSPPGRTRKSEKAPELRLLVLPGGRRAPHSVFLSSTQRQNAAAPPWPWSKAPLAVEQVPLATVERGRPCRRARLRPRSSGGPPCHLHGRPCRARTSSSSPASSRVRPLTACGSQIRRRPPLLDLYRRQVHPLPPLANRRRWMRGWSTSLP